VFQKYCGTDFRTVSLLLVQVSTYLTTLLDQLLYSSDMCIMVSCPSFHTCMSPFSLHRVSVLLMAIDIGGKDDLCVHNKTFLHYHPVRSRNEFAIVIACFSKFSYT
jgi:hypothetical protein